MGIEAIEVKEDKTVKEFIDERQLSSPILLEVNGEVFYADEDYGKILKRGDIVRLTLIIAGG